MHTSVPALLIIDMQKCMASVAAGSRNNPEAERNIATLLARWRELGATVIHVRHISRAPDSLFAPGQAGAGFQALFMPYASEHVLDKNVPDAFTNTALERWLRVRDIDSVIIVGVSTNVSVESSARSAGNLGFETIVVADAAFAFAKTDYAGVARSAHDVHAMALSNLDGEYATIVHTQDLLDQYASDRQGRAE